MQIPGTLLLPFWCLWKEKRQNFFFLFKRWTYSSCIWNMFSWNFKYLAVLYFGVSRCVKWLPPFQFFYRWILFINFHFSFNTANFLIKKICLMSGYLEVTTIWRADSHMTVRMKSNSRNTSIPVQYSVESIIW